MSLLPAQTTPFREADMHGPNVGSVRRFNHYHAQMRVELKNAFGRLKGRWHVLKMISTHPDRAAAIQELRVALHNFLEARDGAYVREDVTAEQTAPEHGETYDMDEAAQETGRARRVEILKALGLPWVVGQ